MGVLIVYLLPFLSFAKVNWVKVDKSENKMILFDHHKKIKVYHIALGGTPKGHKKQEGDKKTPEGSYFLDYKKEKSSFYRAMHISYPNWSDRKKAFKRGLSPGGLIMIHGQKNKFGWLSGITQYFNWTNGCIALSNSDMDEFMDLVDVGTSIQIEW
jgi:murein L,D-transpeptidase YafK